MADLHPGGARYGDVVEAPLNGRERLYQTMAAVLAVDAVTLDDESSPDTIASWDSLNHLNLVMAIEGEYGLSLTAEDAMDMRNVALIRAILKERGLDV